MAMLILNPGTDKEILHPLDPTTMSIGRGEDQAIAIPHRSLSRTHARIERRGAQFYIVDLQSKNGTFVNGLRIEEHALDHGDTVSLGELDLSFFDAPPEAKDPRPDAVRPLQRPDLTSLSRELTVVVPEADSPHLRARLQTLIEVAKLLSVVDDIDVLLEKILDLVFEILNVDRAVILLINPETGEPEPLTVRVSAGATDVRPYSAHIIEHVLQNDVAALFTDPGADWRLDDAESIRLQSIRSSICVPLKPRDETLGVLYIDTTRVASPFTEDDLDFVVAFASQAAISVENAKLYRRLERETVARMQLVTDAKLAAMNAMVVGLAHELRNPLNLLMNFAEASEDPIEELGEFVARVAERETLSDEDLREMSELGSGLIDSMRRIHTNGARANEVVTAMLSHAAPPSARREPADVNDLLMRSVRYALAQSKHTGIELDVQSQLEPELEPLSISVGEIERVLFNVIENALYAMAHRRAEEGDNYAPVLRIQTRLQGQTLELRIADNGTGIPADELAKVFDPFFTTKTSGEGIGLGLTSSHGIIVQGHQGTIRIESELGLGTEVIVGLPITTAATR